MMKKMMLAGAAMLTFAGQASAAPVFQSVPDLKAAPTNNAWCSSCGGNYRVYDKFTLASAAVLSSAQFALQASYGSATKPITVSFSTSVANQPGVEIASYTFDSSAYTSIAAASDVSLYTVALPSLALAAGDYEISFYNPANLGVPGYAGGSGLLYQTGTGFMTGQSAAFALFADGAVPEPATWGMMILGMGAVGVAMRRRRAPLAAVRFG